mmetsp:Transcript_9141/g.35756  ORF Transcript_9141/g.35756 Transcript_9141/m.35756 type:complete len:319 (+) Transcript_9141:180-1136(+)
MWLRCSTRPHTAFVPGCACSRRPRCDVRARFPGPSCPPAALACAFFGGEGPPSHASSPSCPGTSHSHSMSGGGSAASSLNSATFRPRLALATRPHSSSVSRSRPRTTLLATRSGAPLQLCQDPMSDSSCAAAASRTAPDVSASPAAACSAQASPSARSSATRAPPPRDAPDGRLPAPSAPSRPMRRPAASAGGACLASPASPPPAPFAPGPPRARSRGSTLDRIHSGARLSCSSPPSRAHTPRSVLSPRPCAPARRPPLAPPPACSPPAVLALPRSAPPSGSLAPATRAACALASASSSPAPGSGRGASPVMDHHASA